MRRFHINLKPIPELRKLVGMRVRRRIPTIAGQYKEAGFNQTALFFFVKNEIGEFQEAIAPIILLHVSVFVIGVQPLIQERMIALVGGENAVKPIVPHFVRDNLVEGLGIG